MPSMPIWKIIFLFRITTFLGEYLCNKAMNVLVLISKGILYILVTDVLSKPRKLSITY